MTVDEESLANAARLQAMGGWIADPEEDMEGMSQWPPDMECSKQWPDGIIIKSAWGEGPWILEPDLVLFHAKAEPRYPCCVWRHNFFGQLNGYVLIPSGHPVHGMGYNDISCLPLDGHRGVTCGTATAGGSWLVGFHTGHAYDYQPALEARAPRWLRIPRTDDSLPDHLGHLRHTYRDLAYVRAEVETLAAGLGVIGARGTLYPSGTLPCRLCGALMEIAPAATVAAREARAKAFELLGATDEDGEPTMPALCDECITAVLAAAEKGPKQ